MSHQCELARVRCGGWRRQYAALCTSPNDFTFAYYRDRKIHIQRRHQPASEPTIAGAVCCAALSEWFFWLRIAFLQGTGVRCSWKGQLWPWLQPGITETLTLHRGGHKGSEVIAHAASWAGVAVCRVGACARGPATHGCYHWRRRWHCPAPSV